MNTTPRRLDTAEERAWLAISASLHHVEAAEADPAVLPGRPR
jgi:hypothetical protein